MNKKALMAALSIFCFCVCMAAVIADMTGKWTGKIITPDGNALQINYVFKVDGDKLTGTAQGDGPATQIDSGKLTGNDFSFSVSNSDGVIFKHTGKFYPQGDSVGVNINVNGNVLHATLKRDNK